MTGDHHPQRNQVPFERPGGLHRRRGRIRPGEAKKRASAWLDRFELGEWATHKVEDLSKGMQQKMQLIGTILHRPPLLILDEPFSGLDPVNMRLLRDLSVTAPGSKSRAYEP